ncbi:MAG: DUF6288 domain-containing protein [Planctomycetota bacterium]|nr:DUF6288 domain-containing protein [Planctomycetota bacterium]MDA1143258.1 DUF6288 domain-containing protein [Planctomycetota bacterium]
MRGPYTIFGLLIAPVILSSTVYSQEHHLGPTGLFGDVSKTSIKVTKAIKGSPAEGKLFPGDLIIGAGGKLFKENPRKELAAAIDQAETEASKGILKLTLKGKGERGPALTVGDDPADLDLEAELEAETKGTNTVTLQLKVLGTYSATAPFNCPKTEAIVARAADHLVKSGKAASGQLCSGLLGLLATGEQRYIDVVKKAIQSEPWAKPNVDDLMAVIAGEKDMGYVGWYWGYQCITLAEYHLLTGDESVLPAIKAYAVAIAMGQDAGGLWGHRMATEKRSGRLPGYAQINQTSLTLFMGMLLAEKCGVDDPKLQKAIEKTHAFYASFIGKGAFNYGVHGPNTRSYNNNGTSATGALNMALKGDKEGASFFSRLSATSYDALETGHATFYFNVMWTPLGANVAGPEVTTEFFKRSRWLHTLYRSWDGGFTFDGTHPKAGNSTGSHLLAYCIPRRKLYVTGKNADESIWLKGKEIIETIELSQIDYKSKNVDELIAMFGHPIPQVTRRAVWTLREKEGEFIPRLVNMMKEGTKLEKQNAIGYFGYGCPNETAMPRLDDLGVILRDPKEHPEVRAAAAGALCWLGEPAYKYYDDMVKLVVEDEPGDVFGDVDWSVGGSINRLCNEPFKAGLVTDKDLFYKAAIKLIENKRQHVRADGARMLAEMPLEDFHIVGDKVMHLVRDQDSTYHSYHSPGGPVGAGVTLLANLNIEEGIQPVLDTLENESGKWAFKLRMIMSTLPKYGGNAKSALEKLKADPRLKTIEQGRFGGAWKAMVKAIEEDEAPRKLMTLEEAKQVGQNGPNKE